MKHKTLYSMAAALALAGLGIQHAYGACVISASTVSDNFSTFHDYSGGNISGTMWSGTINGGSIGSGSDTGDGTLHFFNDSDVVDGYDAGYAGATLAPTLFVNVAGDFDLSIEILPQPGTTGGAFSDSGLVARVPNLLDAGSGEDWLTWMYFDFSGLGTNRVRESNDDSVSEQGAFLHKTLLRMVRTGNSFTFFSKDNNLDPTWDLQYSSVRNDLDGLSLQVGLQHSAYTGNTLRQDFDNVSLTYGAFWDGESDGNWSAKTNWNADQESKATDDITFLGTGETITLSSGEVANSVNFCCGDGYVFTGGDLTLTSGVITVDDQTASQVTATINSVLNTGTNTLTKLGADKLVLGGANTFTGLTTVSAGTLNIQNNNALGTSAGGTLVSSGAALEVQGGITVSNEALTLNGSGVSNGGALRSVSGNNNYNGNITLGSSSRINSETAGQTLTINPSSGNAISGTGDVTLGGAGNIVINDPIANTGGLTKDGSGTLTLGADNTYTGAMNITGGTITLQAGPTTVSIANAGFESPDYGGGGWNYMGEGIINPPPGWTVYSPHGVDVGAGIGNNGSPWFGPSAPEGTQAGFVQSSGSNGFFSQVLNFASAGNYTLNFQAVGRLTQSNGFIITIDGNTIIQRETTDIGDGSWQSFSIPGIALSAGSHTLTFTGNNLVGGGDRAVAFDDIQIFGGTGVIDAIPNSSAVTIALGALLDLNDTNETIGSLAGAGNVTLGSGALTFGGNNSSTTFSGAISESGSVVKTGTGTQIFSGANSYTGTTVVDVGVLNLQNGTALGSTAGGTSVTIGAAIQVQGGITITGEALTLRGDGISADGALRNISGNNNYNGNITLAADTRINSDANTLTIDPASGNAISGGFNLTLGGAGNIVIGAALANGGTVTKDGNGTATLTDSNSNTGQTNINDGVLNIQNGGALGAAGAGTVVADGAALQLQGNITVTGEALTISGMGVANDGALRSLSGNNNFNGNITLGADSRINSDTAGQTLILDPASGNAISGAFDVIFGGVGNILIGAPVANGGDVTKDGNGTLTFTEANTYTGSTLINDGALNIQNGAALGTTGAGTTVANGAALQLQGGITVVGESLTINGTGESNDGALRSVSGNNSFNGNITLGSDSRINSDTIGDTLTIDPASGNAISGAFDIIFGGAGNIVVGAPVANGGDVTKDGNGTLTFTDSNSFTGTTFINDGVLNVQNGGALGTTGAGTVVADGAALQLQGNIIITDEPLTISGMGVANDGALRSVSGDNSFNANIVLGADSRINSDTVGDTLTIDPALGNAISGAFDVFFGGAGNILVGAPIANGGDLNKDGTGILTLDAINTYTGDTNIYNGTILISGGGPINSNAIPDLSDVFIDMLGTFNLNNHNETIGSLSGSGNVILGSGTLTTGGNNADTTFSGSISGTGGLIKEGDGTFTLSGVNTYTGDTSVNDGVLIVTGSIVSNVNVGAGGTLGGNGTFGGTTTVSGVLGDPDSTGEMIFDGDLVLLGTAVLNMQIGGTLASQYDHLTLNANFTIDGTLNVTLINGFSPVPGNSFDLFDFNPLNTSGTFDAINLPGLPFDFTWDVSDLYDTGVLAVVPEPSTFGLLALGSVIALRRRRK